jgi:hypothetical protein
MSFTLGRGQAGKAMDFESMYRTFESYRPSLIEGKGETMTLSPERYVTPVTWLAAPEWLTLEQAAALTGHSVETIQAIIEAGGVELKDGEPVLIERRSLHEFQVALAEVIHWHDDDDDDDDDD